MNYRDVDSEGTKSSTSKQAAARDESGAHFPNEPLAALHWSVGNQAVQNGIRSETVDAYGSDEDASTDSPQTALPSSGETDTTGSPTPTAALCPECLHRYRAGAPLDCPACEESLDASTATPPIKRWLDTGRLQPKLEVSSPNDRAEREAKRIASEVIRATDIPSGPSDESVSRDRDEETSIPSERDEHRESRACPSCRRAVGRSEAGASSVPTIDGDLERRIRSLGGGRPLSGSVRSFFEPRFGRDFGDVRVHTGTTANETARSIRAEAFTVGRDIAFAEGTYRPETTEGRELLAHELTHVVQNREGAAPSRSEVRRSPSNDDLTSPRFADDPTLENVLDGTEYLSLGDRGRAVARIQHALVDAGHFLSQYGVDGVYGRETADAVEAFQRDAGLDDDGIVGPKTMEALDERYRISQAGVDYYLKFFGGSPWTEDCVRTVLCLWSEGLVQKLQNYTVKRYDKIYWEDKKWDGNKWVDDPFPGGGYQDTKQKEIGILSKRDCEIAAGILYHEAFHAAQPSSLSKREKEKRAYRFTEEWKIGLGLSGRSSFRETDPATGRTEVDVGAVESHVKKEYPGPGSGSPPGEEIIGRKKMKLKGWKKKKWVVIMRRPDGSTYPRPPRKGDKVPGPMITKGEKDIDTSTWGCP